MGRGKVKRLARWIAALTGGAVLAGAGAATRTQQAPAEPRTPTPPKHVPTPEELDRIPPERRTTWYNPQRFVLFALGMAVCLCAAWYLNHLSFDYLRQMREFERLPGTEVRALIEGEAHLAGRADGLGQVLEAPFTNTPCFYYRYTIEREERDSEGKTKWVTEHQSSRYVDFALRDASGAVPLRLSPKVNFSINRSIQRVVGDRRHTESRIDIGSQFLAVGWAERSAPNGGFEIHFNRPGSYTPLISNYGETAERSGWAVWSLFACWGALVLASLSVALLLQFLFIHRLIVYLVCVSVLLIGGLIHMGLTMMLTDMVRAHQRLLQHHANATAEVTHELREHGVEWNGTWATLGDLSSLSAVSEYSAARVRRIRIDLERAIRRTNERRSSPVERLVAWLAKVPAVSSIPLPSGDEALLRHLEGQFRPATVHPLLAFPVFLGMGSLGILFTWMGFKRVQIKRAIENLPTSPTAGVVYGLTEVKGIIEPIADTQDATSGNVVVEGPLSRKPCIYYHYLVEERRGSGKNAKWVVIENKKETLAFHIRDQHGTIRAMSAGAEIYTFHKTSTSSGSMRYREYRLEPGDPVYAFGTAMIDQVTLDELYIGNGRDGWPYILGNLTEREIQWDKANTGRWLLNLALQCMVLAGLMAVALILGFSAGLYTAAATLAIAYLMALYLGLLYNDLVFLRQRVARNLSNIDVALKKRADLLPALENTVHAMMKHERLLLERIADLRRQHRTLNARDVEGIGAFIASEERLLTTLMGLREDYPQLTADSAARGLFDRLTALENEIALMRDGYNDAVKTYNQRLATIPENVIALLTGCRRALYLNELPAAGA